MCAPFVPAGFDAGRALQGLADASEGALHVFHRSVERVFGLHGSVLRVTAAHLGQVIVIEDRVVLDFDRKALRILRRRNGSIPYFRICRHILFERHRRVGGFLGGFLSRLFRGFFRRFFSGLFRNRRGFFRLAAAGKKHGRADREDQKQDQ